MTMKLAKSMVIRSILIGTPNELVSATDSQHIVWLCHQPRAMLIWVTKITRFCLNTTNKFAPLASSSLIISLIWAAGNQLVDRIVRKSWYNQRQLLNYMYWKCIQTETWLDNISELDKLWMTTIKYFLTLARNFMIISNQVSSSSS